MRPFLVSLALVAGCAGKTPDCSEGFERGEGDLCYEQAPTTTLTTTGTTSTTTDLDAIEAWFAGLEDCGLPPGDGTIDLEAGCLAGACVGMTLDEMNTALGEAPTCEPFLYEFAGYSFSYLDCAWSNGVNDLFEDADRDGQVDPGATSFGLQADLPFAGTTSEGLGLGVSLACFVPILGEPDTASFEPDERGDWRLVSASRSLLGVYAYDYSGGGPYEFDSDGEVESITVYGSML